MSLLDALAARTGGTIHALAQRSRRLAGPRPAPGPGAPVAVVCDTLVRYGMAQAVGLREAGYDVVCYWIDRLTDFGDDPADAERERQLFLDHAARGGVELVRLPRRDLRRIVQQTRWLHRDIARRGIAALVVQPHLDPRYATLGLRFPTLFVMHDPRPHTGDYDSHHAAPFRAITRFAELTAAELMVHGEPLRRQVRRSLVRVPMVVVPHGADVTDVPLPVPVEPTILLVGRLMAYKGIDVALAALPQIRAAVPGARMVIAGKGRMADEVRRAAADGVALHDGYIPEAELVSLLQQASVVVLPYRDATQSGVGLQAVARGIPCVVSRSGALPDLVPDEHPGWVVPPGDADALAAAVISALGHGPQDRRQVHELARSTFDWAQVGRRLGGELRGISA